MRFAMSYSCGKDSTMALSKMIQDGHEPVALVVAGNHATKRSFFHGADEAILEAYSDALGIPLIVTYSDGDDYRERFLEGLLAAKEMGAEAICYGDIYLDGSKAWNEAVAIEAGLIPLEPLWGINPEKNVYELLDQGYQCMIKIIDHTLLPENLLGRILDADAIRIMKDCGIDVCGENGEYHTFVIDGPIFRHPVELYMGQLQQKGKYTYICLNASKAEGIA